MIYTEGVTVIMGACLLFYVLFGGADFGAGIVEIFTGDKGKKTISRALAPVWEANHIWLIIVVVILFNGFPVIYSELSIALHIPILILLVGIIARGAAFTFRHYDAFQDRSQIYYSFIFRYSSILTTLFLGIITAALTSGTIPVERNNFYHYFMAPWLTPFCLSVGIFTSVLSAYIASIFLLGEVEDNEEYDRIKKFSKRLLLAAMISGGFIFLASYFEDLTFHRNFLGHPYSIIAVVLATLLIPLVVRFIEQEKLWLLRIAAAAQVVLILMGWFTTQWPYLIVYADGSRLNIHDAAAPTLVMKVLFWSLISGVILIFPALIYLFKVFKVKTAGR